MTANLAEYGVMSCDLCLDPVRSGPLATNLYLSEGSHSEPQSPQLTGNWQKRENTEGPEADEDLELHQLMEDIKRYIRSIDIGKL